MYSTLQRRNFLWSLPLVILSSSLFLVLSPAVPLSADLVVGITIDMAVLMPFTYWLAIRKTSIPKTTIIPVFIGSVLIMGQLLPPPHTQIIGQIETYLFPALELFVLGLLVSRVRAFRKAFPKDRPETDFLLLIREAATEVLKNRRIAQVFATEIAIFYYAFFTWKKPQASGFSHYRKNGMIALFWAVILILLVETFVLHIFLMRWNAIVAWIVFGLSIYGAIQIFSHIKALGRRRSSFKNGSLHLKYGLFGDTSISLDNIASWEWTRKRINTASKKVQQLSLLGELEPHNLVIHLEEPAQLTKAYGIQKSFTQLMLHVDDQEDFEALLQEKTKL